MQKPYRYSKDADRCDQTWDIYAGDSLTPIISIPFWDDEVETEALARHVVAALNAYQPEE